MGLKEQIEGKQNAVLGQHLVEEWETTIYIRKISMADQIAVSREGNGVLPYEERPMEGTSDLADIYTFAKYAFVGAANADGSRIWPEGDAEDEDERSKQTAESFAGLLACGRDAIQEVGIKVAHLNGLLDKAAENTAKNSEAIQSASSRSASPKS